MKEALKSGFPPFKDEQSLRSAIESVCAEFGKVSSLEILPAMPGSGLHCACFVRLDSPAAEEELMSKLRVIKFGVSLHFFADVDEGWAGEYIG